jgi:hypothetical protein
MMTLLRLKKNLFWEKGQRKNEQQKNVITSQEERAQNYIRTKHKINTSTVNNQENWLCQSISKRRCLLNLDSR